jgi:hypothetical protein
LIQRWVLCPRRELIDARPEPVFVLASAAAGGNKCHHKERNNERYGLHALHRPAFSFFNVETLVVTLNYSMSMNAIRLPGTLKMITGQRQIPPKPGPNTIHQKNL